MGFPMKVNARLGMESYLIYSVVVIVTNVSHLIPLVVFSHGLIELVCGDVDDYRYAQIPESSGKIAEYRVAIQVGICIAVTCTSLEGSRI